MSQLELTDSREKANIFDWIFCVHELLPWPKCKYLINDDWKKNNFYTMDRFVDKQVWGEISHDSINFFFSHAESNMEECSILPNQFFKCSWESWKWAGNSRERSETKKQQINKSFTRPNLCINHNYQSLQNIFIHMNPWTDMCYN